MSTLVVKSTTAINKEAPTQGAPEADIERIDGLLSSEQKQRVDDARWLSESLRSTRLVDTIETILSAGDRRTELKKHRKNPEFEEFVSKLMNEINVGVLGAYRTGNE